MFTQYYLMCHALDLGAFLLPKTLRFKKVNRSAHWYWIATFNNVVLLNSLYIKRFLKRFCFVGTLYCHYGKMLNDVWKKLRWHICVCYSEFFDPRRYAETFGRSGPQPWADLTAGRNTPQMLFGGFTCSTLHPCSPLSERLCVYYWQEALTGKATQPEGKGG